ncbi:NADH-quinone oxidoreductase subunit NuoB [Deferribacter autotrophicus]|uniref:NADH-quinone oxidoreductase subunit NuoB n=1 Tax=Deferribacter autotrophicus TaxID=500465 RepID=A0A5A8F5C5_9BACT|nr:NADH-quinone oxidoreductase subunit NuoB [Deferribacter autotrophicus]KAA0258245.1 NADH-quinone oxidoreductase subunit NuoB [Deferribacter autotrophicus]
MLFSIIKNRIEQGYRTSKYPNEEIKLPERFKGKPEINSNCEQKIAELCASNCPQDAIDPKEKTIHLGKCVFCGLCEELSNGSFIKFSNDFELAVTDPEQLIYDGMIEKLEIHAKKHFKKLFGRSLQLRQVSAGGCNACEADLNVLNTPFFDLSRFGIQFVASPRHADGIIVTGPVTRNMKKALLKTYEAIPDPKIVIASGSCAISGGPFRGNPEQLNGVDGILKVDLYIPGCPPHPLTTLHALLTFFK